ncbi:MAG: DUF2231 domain-containing protein [Bacteroidia bacterium]|nr:DUF2231 domain-containing protein [Bacteroidia bacterium]
MISATHLHSMIIHFPIALLIAGFFSEVIALITKKNFFKNVAFYLLILGAIGTVASYLSGESAGEGIENGPLKIPIDLHEDAAVFTLWLAIITAAFKVMVYFMKWEAKWTKWTGILLFTLLIGSVSRTGYLGGQLVFKHGAGIELALPDFSNTEPED